MATHSVLQRAKAQLVLHEPFFATLMLQMPVVETDKVNGKPLWMAATDSQTLYVNPENFNKLTVAVAKGVLKHEIMHVAQMHNYRAQGREQQRWNHACDYAINPMILDEGGELPPGVLDGSSFKGQSAEQIYAQLPPMPPKDPNAKPDPNGNPMDDDVLPAPDQSQAAQDKTKSRIVQAANVAKARGKLPSHIREAIDEVMKPKVDWFGELREFLTESNPTDYSFSRPNRRYIAGEDPMYLPSLVGTDSMRGLGVVLDTSGSITMHELGQGLGEIVGAVVDVAPKRLVVAYCDAKVQHSDVFDQPGEAQVAETFERHGNGGTSMPAGLKWFKRNHPDIQAVMVYTDGETEWGNEDDYPFPVLWAITNARITAPWGRTIHIELD